MSTGRRGESEGFTSAIMTGEEVEARGRLSVLRGDCRCRVGTSTDEECEQLSPADRRRPLIECPSTCVLPESGICVWQSRRDAHHRFSALSAGGEVQKVAPSYRTDRQSECSVLSSCVIGVHWLSIGGTARNGTHSTHVSASLVHAFDRCSCARVHAHVNRRTRTSTRRTNDKAQAVIERAGPVATDGLCCYGGSS